ncbi:hypothetical protein Mgra_00008206 [Meloidogyne graminicola]|uniref:Uncharacterized protein n=1 Tax=Meloidogyne graminicola TaxID=189291 RepID=A0A8S9ZGB1_9BILA|nr:hypothetical protein Mgra_00008206 [Meloidogyne graminicola]
MLGMMNCPTENFEFYSASPSAIKQLNSSRSNANSPKSSRQESDNISLDEEKLNKQRGLEVFSEVKKREKISYTPDGRRMIEGKLEAPENKPEQLWGKLIGDSITTRKFFESQKQGNKQINEENKTKNIQKKQKEIQNVSISNK